VLAVVQLMKLSATTKAIASSLVLALLGVVGTQISTHPSLATVGYQAPPVPQNQASASQLLGQWQAKDSTSGKTVTLIFTPENQLFMLLPPRDGSTVGIKMGYQVNLATQPMQMDLKLSSDRIARTIFEFTKEGKLRLELESITDGKPRPTTFSPRNTLFEKISDITTVPKNVQLVDIENQQDKPRPNIALQYITILSKAQQAYYLKNGKFAAGLEDLGIITNSETESYRYQMVVQGDRADSVTITAQAKTSGVSSYTGVVFVNKINGTASVVTVICATNQPSTSPPTIPKYSASDSLEIQCPTGSSLVH
jgi:hypothetical protein